MTEYESRGDSNWNEFLNTLEESLAKLQSSYQRMNQLDAPRGVDDATDLWQWADHHAAQSCKAAPQYSCKMSNGAMQVGQVDLAKLLAQLSQFADKWKPLSTIWLYVDNRSLVDQDQPQ